MGYRAYSDFTAQGRNVGALMNLYANLEADPGKRAELTPIIVFLGFSIESYLNSLGARQLEIWDEIERLPWRNKVEILHKIAGRTPEWGKEPLQFAIEVFRVRDKLAHGKPERVLGTVHSNYGQAEADSHDRELQPDWYRGITREWVLEAKGRFRRLMTYLGGLFGYHESDHLHFLSGGVLTDDEADA